MTSIKINHDDQGLRNLQVDNSQPVTSSPVLPVKATKPVQSSPANQTIVTSPPERRHSERRNQANRRQEKVPVLLDTRIPHDRRTQPGHRTEDQENKISVKPDHGIDTEV